MNRNAEGEQRQQPPFSQDALAVLEAAKLEPYRHRQKAITPNHLLAGVLTNPSIGSQLESILTLSSVRATTEAFNVTGLAHFLHAGEQPQPTHSTRQALEEARKLAIEEGATATTSVHILRGVLRLDEGKPFSAIITGLTEEKALELLSTTKRSKNTEL